MPEQTDNKDDACWTAIKDAADTLQEKCGKSPDIKLDVQNVTLTIPPEVKEVIAQVQQGLITRDELVQSIMQTAWGKDTVRSICVNLLGVVEGTPEYDECFQRVASNLVNGMIE